MTTKDELLQSIRACSTDERKLEYIEKEIKKGLAPELKIVALKHMAEIYEKRNWFSNAARGYCYSADLAPTFRERMELYFKGAIMYVQLQDYFSADDVFRKVLVLATSNEKPVIQEKINQLYLQQAQEYEKSNHYTKAIKAFSKVVTLKLPLEKINSARETLANLYEKIGKPRDASFVRAQKQR